MTLAHIFQKPKIIENVGEVYSVLMKDYDDFMDKANILSYSYAHFAVDEISKSMEIPKEEIKLLDLITIISTQTESFEQAFDNLNVVFSIVLRKPVENTWGENGIYFFSGDEYLIDRNNYDDVRKAIMEQNLIFEPKVFKSKLTQEWAERVLQTRAKSSVNITIEDMVTTVAVLSGKHYWDLENYSYYQLKAEFSRISKIKNYDTSSQLLGNPYASDVKLDHYAENVEMFKSPYDDIFVSKNKLSKLNSALGEE